jgi:hypothetical protein
MPSSPWLTAGAEADAEGEGTLALAEDEDKLPVAADEALALELEAARAELAAGQARLTSRRLAKSPRRSTGIGTKELSKARGRRSEPTTAAPAPMAGWWARERESALCRAWLARAECDEAEVATERSDRPSRKQAMKGRRRLTAGIARQRADCWMMSVGFGRGGGSRASWSEKKRA